MILQALLAPLLLLPYAAADGIHRLKLKKLPSTSSNPALESAYLAEKYGGRATSQYQTPLMGSGGSGRKVRIGRPGQDNDDLFWTQDMLTKGGHGVPLSSMYRFDSCGFWLTIVRFHECPILHGDSNWHTPPDV